MMFRTLIPRKGLHSCAVRRLASDIATLGHADFVLKRDGLPSIVALKEAVQREMHERIRPLKIRGPMM